MKFKRYFILFGAFLTFSTAAHADLASIFTNTAPAAHTAIPRRTSIIFIQCHDLAPGDLSCYGQTNYQTPNLDRLARNGIRFTHYSGGVESPATTAMLLSGKASAVAVDESNLAQQLGQSGYRTSLIGEWGLPGKPWLQGFDEFAGFLDDAAARNYYADHVWRYAPGSILSQDGKHRSAYEGQEMIYANMDGKKGQYIPDLFMKAMQNFIRENQPDFFNHYRPFFLLLNLSAPRSAAIGKDDFPVPTDAPFTGENWPQAAKNRAALITRLDDGIGQLLEQLNKLKMTNDVAIFFSSSSAPEKFANTNMNFMLPKHDFRDAKTTVPPTLPMLAYWPGTIPTNQVSDKAWTAADFAPTALEIGYVKPNPHFAGHSLLPLLKGGSPDQPAGSKH
ncbi:MAG TPA: sulfatase-like hydrolase/transferase [Candidatus Binatia bacterium]|nr:sulfatase-like hydrolase/transferase [Candidatus Binatia bacterium]